MQQISGRELVAGGDIKWKPINKQAALMLAKSPEINKPPTNTTMNSLAKNYKDANSSADFMTEEDRTVQAAGLGKKMVSKADKTIGSAKEFADQVVEARRILEDATDMMRSDVIAFTEEMPAAVERMRQWRMTLEREKEMTLKILRELRQFFLEDAHEKEMARLNEFVRTCERLAALAKDGTLEKVSEVMLKLAGV